MNAYERNRVIERTKDAYNRQPVDAREVLQQMDRINYLSARNLFLCAVVSDTNEGVCKTSVFAYDPALVPSERFPMLVEAWRSETLDEAVRTLESLYGMVEFSCIDLVNAFREHAHDVRFNNVFRYPAMLSYTATTGVASVASSFGEALSEQVHLGSYVDYSSVSAYGDLVIVRERLRNELSAIERMMGNLIGTDSVSCHHSLTSISNDDVLSWVERQRDIDADEATKEVE